MRFYEQTWCLLPIISPSLDACHFARCKSRMSERARVVTTTNAQKLAALDRVARGEPLKTVAQQLKVSRQMLWIGGPSRAHRKSPTGQGVCRREEAPPPRCFLYPLRSGTLRVYFPGAYIIVCLLITCACFYILLDWITDMRCKRFLCVSTACIRLMLARLDPEFVRARTLDAITMLIWRFLRRNNLTLRRITHRGQKPRSDIQVF